MNIDIIEGFFFKLKNGDIFYAKGVIHPPNYVISYPKYVVDYSGDRVDEKGVRYRKISRLNEEYKYVLDKYASYIKYDEFFCRNVAMIPLVDISYIYNPIDKARKLIELEPRSPVLINAKEMILDIISSTNVKDIGISGSILVDLYRDDSDIDIVIYGFENGYKVYKYLKEVVGKDPRYKRYGVEDITQLYLRRILETPIPFNQAVYQESRKVLEGYFRGREYFIRLVKLPHEEPVYGSYRCIKIGRTTMKLRVVDASESMFTPCRYKVEIIEYVGGVKAEVSEVYSLRGRFAEIAQEDEVIVVHGTVERIEIKDGRTYYRLYVGDEKDYIIVIH